MATPSPSLVARAKLAGADTINTYLEKEWLPEVGREIVRRVGGTFKVAFKQGFVVSVTTGNPETVEVIGIRINSYRSEVTLHHVLGGDAAEVDMKAFPEVMGYTPGRLADWAVEATQGRAQTHLPFTRREIDERERRRQRREQRS